jgi:hypothetical protein
VGELIEEVFETLFRFLRIASFKINFYLKKLNFLFFKNSKKFSFLEFHHAHLLLTSFHKDEKLTYFIKIKSTKCEAATKKKS